MTKPIAAHYQLAQQKIQDGKWRVDPDLGLVYGVKGQPFSRLNSWGYIQIKFRRAENYNLEVAVLAHRVIWDYVNGPLVSHLQINHLNGIKTDNRLANMEAATASQNLRHSFATGLHPRRSRRTLTAEQALEIYQRSWSGLEREDDIGPDYGVGRSLVNNIHNGWCWADVTGHVPRQRHDVRST
jgi:hypothetical protein